MSGLGDTVWHVVDVRNLPLNSVVKDSQGDTWHKTDKDEWTLDGKHKVTERDVRANSHTLLYYYGAVTVMALPTEPTVFQQGDRVRFVEDYEPGPRRGAYKGDVGTVYRVKDTNHHNEAQLVSLDLDKGHFVTAFGSRMEKIEPEVSESGRLADDEPLPLWERALLYDPPIYVGDPVTVTGWSTSFDGDGFVSRVVQRAHDLTYTVDFPGRTGDFESGAFPEEYVTLRAVMESDVVPDSALINAYVGTQEGLDALPDGTLIVSLRGSVAYAKTDGDWFTVDGVKRTHALRFAARNEGLVVVGVNQA